MLEAEANLGDLSDDSRSSRLFLQFLSAPPVSGGSQDVGDSQVTSNIETDRSLQHIGELWYEYGWGDAARIKFGKLDANSEFAFIEAAGNFSHSSAGFSPTIFALPTYPEPATGAVLWSGSDLGAGFRASLGYGLFDGAFTVDGVSTGRRGPSTFFKGDASDDLFHIAQLGLEWEPADRYSGSALVGAWKHDGDFVRFDGTDDSGTFGSYFAFDQELPPFVGESLTVFGQLGDADERVSEIRNHASLGFVVDGPLLARPQDSMGLYASRVDFADEVAPHHELAFDAFYRVQATDAFFVQPELQFVVHPGGDPAIGDALVLFLRAGLTL